MSERGGPVIGVIGGSGGVGSSSFAAILALVAAPSLLVDLDAVSGGIDVLLGIESVSGARWSGLGLAGGRLDPDDLRAGLPQVAGTAVLAADVSPAVAAVEQVVSAGARLGPVVLDLPRSGIDVRDAGLALCDFVVIVVRADVPGLVAAHTSSSAVLDGLTGRAAEAAGLVLRRGPVSGPTVAELIGLPVLGELPATAAGHFTIDAQHPPRAAARIAAGVLAGVRA